MSPPVLRSCTGKLTHAARQIRHSPKDFAITRTFPTDLNQFIQDELQTGNYADEDAVLAAALEVFREVRQRHAKLRGRVQESLAQAHAREATPLDMDEMAWS